MGGEILSKALGDTSPDILGVCGRVLGDAPERVRWWWSKEAEGGRLNDAPLLGDLSGPDPLEPSEVERDGAPGALNRA